MLVLVHVHVNVNVNVNERPPAPQDTRRVLRNLSAAVTLDPSRVTAADPLGTVPRAAIVFDGGAISWLGAESDLPGEYAAAEQIDGRGHLALPGLVECHTHLVFAGERSAEFHLRNTGRGYAEILEAGGGLLSTVAATRAASEEELIAAALPRLRRMLIHGITTCEIKSGYGLDLENELKILRVVRTLQDHTPIRLVPTFLGAHAFPPEYRERREDYLRLVIEEMIPAASEAGLARFCDVFCEGVAFSVTEARRVLEAGRAHGLIPKIHAEQLTRQGGCALAAELGAVSADHCDHVDDTDIAAMAGAGVTAVLLPGATFFVGDTQYAPARKLLDGGVRVALSTDCNPGSTMTENLTLMTTFGGCVLKMSAAELIAAITVNAAAALALQDEVGSLAPGLAGDVALLDIPDAGYLPYHYGVNHLAAVVKAGAVVHQREGGAG